MTKTKTSQTGKENYTRKAFIGFAWVAIGAFLANLFSYLLRLLLARNLTVEEYGLVYAVMALFGLLSVLQYMGLSEAVVKYVSTHLVKKERARIKEVVFLATATTYTTTFLIMIIAFFTADWLGAVYFKSAAAPLLIRIYAIGIFLASLTNILLSTFDAHQRMHYRAIFESVQAFTLLAATAVFLALGLGVLAPILAYPFLYVVLYALCIPILLRLQPGFLRLKARYRLATLKELLRYGIPVMLTGVAYMVLSYTDTFFLTLFSGLEEVGIYQAAQPTAKILMVAASILSVVLFPIVAELWARKKKTLITAALKDLYRYALVATLPLLIGVAAFPELVLNLLFGADYLSGAPILRVLAISSLFLILNALNVAVASGIGQPKLTTVAVAAGAVINIILNVLLIPRYAGLGAAYATLIASIVIFLIGIWQLRKHISVGVPLFGWMKALLCGLLFWAVLLFSRPLLPIPNQYLKVFVAGVLALFFFIGGVLLTRTVTFTEVISLKQRIIAQKSAGASALPAKGVGRTR